MICPVFKASEPTWYIGGFRTGAVSETAYADCSPIMYMLYILKHIREIPHKGIARAFVHIQQR